MRTGVGRWLRESALPLWTTAGWDADARMFVERLDLDGAPLLDVPRRTMVQCRQIVVMCLAARNGWSGAAADLAVAAADTLLSRFASPDGAPGFVFALDRRHAIVDPRRDLYTHAFVLLACAEFAKLTGDGASLDRADETLRFLDARMGAPPGYAESHPPRSEPRRQNPHMHLFEALLALHEADAARGYLDRATRLLDLLVDRLLVGDPPVLVEDFAEDWTPLDGPDHAFEPGHHFEWVWLLDWHARLAGRRRHPCAEALWSSAVALGTTQDRRVLDKVRASGAVVEASIRLWPFTEAARAASLGVSEAVTAVQMLDAMQRRFLDPRGTWIDRVDKNGAALSTSVPASSLYHICGAVEAIERQPASAPA